MSREREIVVTAYGHDKVIDKIAISSFDESSSRQSYNSEKNAETYCDMINSLEVKEGSWVFAKIVSENTPFDLKMLFPFKFEEVLLLLDARAIQKVLREIKTQYLVMALKGASDNVIEKVYKNMSKRTSQMLKEDLKCAWTPARTLIRDSQDKILTVIRHLGDTGEILIPEQGRI